MSYGRIALIALLALSCSAVSTQAMAAPESSATGTIGISFYIPPRVEIRQASGASGDLCADAATNRSLLRVIAEDGRELQDCSADMEAKVAATGIRSLVVSPV